MLVVLPKESIAALAVAKGFVWDSATWLYWVS